VIPPWYASDVMYLVYSWLILSLILLFTRVVNDRKQRKMKNELTLLESQLNLLRNQINPHYLSNSLMSLQSVVLDNNKEKAFEFIGQYGKVMRSILEKSDYSFISLDQEIETLKEYIKLEGLIRNISIDFDYRFYSNNTDATITNVKVPTMIFQPFVENVIIHGLVPHKQQLNRIQFDIKLKDKLLNVIITDNGLGYNKKVSERKSYGLDNIQNRLKAYSKLLKIESFFTIENIGNESNLETGTRVTLKIPYLVEPENKN
jgi:LytS/YehU family sensor histidine kinase